MLIRPELDFGCSVATNWQQPPWQDIDRQTNPQDGPQPLFDVQARIEEIDRLVENEPDYRKRLLLLEQALERDGAQPHFQTALRRLRERRDLADSIVAQAALYRDRGKPDAACEQWAILRSLYADVSPERNVAEDALPPGIEDFTRRPVQSVSAPPPLADRSPNVGAGDPFEVSECIDAEFTPTTTPADGDGTRPAPTAEAPGNRPGSNFQTLFDEPRPLFELAQRKEVTALLPALSARKAKHSRQVNVTELFGGRGWRPSPAAHRGVRWTVVATLLILLAATAAAAYWYWFTPQSYSVAPAAAKVTAQAEPAAAAEVAAAAEQKQAVEVFADGSDAKASIDGAAPKPLPHGNFSAEVEPGAHRLELTASGQTAIVPFEALHAALPIVSVPVVTGDTEAVVVGTYGDHLSIASTISSGEVRIDGGSMGHLDGGTLELSRIAPGPHLLAVTSDGGVTVQANIEAASLPRISAFLHAAPARGAVIVSTGEDGVRVLVDGAPYPRLTSGSEVKISMPVGEHRIRVQKEGYRTEPERLVEVTKNKPAIVAFVLQPVAGAHILAGIPAAKTARAPVMVATRSRRTTPASQAGELPALQDKNSHPAAAPTSNQQP